MYSYPYGYMQNQNFSYNPNMYSSPQPMATNTNKIYVNGVEDARNRPLPANSDFIMLDNDKPLLYQKIVDNKGQFEVKTFNISPYKPAEETNKQSSIDLSSYAKTDDLRAIESQINDLKQKIENLNKAGGEEWTH